MNQIQVDDWLSIFVKKLQKIFKSRLIFVGHTGSWARGEAKQESDIDTVVVLDYIDAEDLKEFRNIIKRMPDAGTYASGVLLSISELKALPRYDLMQFFYGCKILYGTVTGIIKRPSRKDMLDWIRVIAAENLHSARHYFLYPHNLRKVVHNLKYPFKNCFYALQTWILVENNKYIARKNDILKFLKDPDDKKVVIVAMDWKELENDRTKRPLYYIKLLERWSRRMLLRLEEKRGERVF